MVNRNKTTNYPTIQPSNWRLRRLGISLIELLIVIFILSMITLLIGSVFISNLRLSQNQNAQIEASNQSRLALDEMVNQIRQAESVAFKCCAPPPEFSRGSVLILKLWPIDGDSAPCDPASGGTCPTDHDHIIYRRNVSQLIKQVVPAPGSSRPPSLDILSSVLTPDASGLNFAYFDAIETPILPSIATGSFAVASDAARVYSVAISLSTQVKTGIEPQNFTTITQETRATLRNKP